MPTYKLYYINARGYAEVSRLILAAAGQEFEDIRYERAELPSHKAEMPLGQIPVLDCDGFKLPQSSTIARFLANQFHLAGKDNFEQAKVDAVVDTINDFVAIFLPTIYETDETKRQELAHKFLTVEVPKHLPNLETLMKLYGNDGPYFVGNSLTWADLLFHSFGETLLGLDENCLNNHPFLKQNRAEVEKHPRLAEYLKNRPQTQF